MQYKQEIREQVDRCIRDAVNSGFTIQGTIDFIKDKTGITISRASLFQRRHLLRKINKNAWNKYIKDDFAYRLEYIESMNRVRRVRDIAYADIIRYDTGQKKDIFYKQRSTNTFLDADRRYLEYLDRIPEIAGLGHEVEPSLYEQPEEPTTQAALSNAKF